MVLFLFTPIFFNTVSSRRWSCDMESVEVRKRAPLFLFNNLFKLRFTNYSKCTVWSTLQYIRLDSLFKCVYVEILRSLYISCSSKLSFEMSAETPMSTRIPEKKNWRKNFGQPFENIWKKIRAVKSKFSTEIY